MKLILLLAVPLFLSAGAQADWQWKNDLCVAKPVRGGYEARFNFTNNGAGPITVGGLNFSCPCTVFQFEAGAVRPGKEGTLVIHLEPQGNVIPGADLDVIASGDASTTCKTLTIHIPDSGPQR